MSHTKPHILATALLGLLALVAASPAGAAIISLDGDPTPPAKVLNDGTGVQHFSWRIEFDTTCCSPYLFDVLDPSLTPIPEFVPPLAFPCGPAPLVNSYDWHVPAGQPCGGYHGRVRFYSDWQGAGTCTLQDQALVSFVIGAGATFRVCKFLDINHNGIKDPGEPSIPNWTFQLVNCQTGQVLQTQTTGPDGCATFKAEVECTGTTNVCIKDVLPPGWAQTTQGGVNPFTVALSAGTNPDVLVGNWQPVLICGSKYLDQAPWPWMSPHFVGPDGQQNPAAFEPVPPCPQPALPAACASPTQPGQLGIGGVTVRLYDNTNPATPVLLATTSTAVNGSYCFGPVQWRPNFKIVVDNPAPAPPACEPPLADAGLSPWAGTYFGTVATSPWPCRIVDFAKPHELQITVPAPVTTNQVYGCNNFFNWQPSRLFGRFCDSTVQMFPTINVGVGKDGFPYIPDSVTASGAGFYQVPPIPVDPEGLRPGVYRLTPPALPNPATQSWQVTTYCDSIHGNSTFTLLTDYVDVGVGHSADVRVDFCIIEKPSERRCFLPVTFTQPGWHNFCDIDSPIIPGGMIYNRFRKAFANFLFYGVPLQGKLVVGKMRTITFEDTTLALQRLCLFLPQTGPCGKLNFNYVNPWQPTTGGALAGEAVALTMNVAYNDKRLMPRSPGYDLENFTFNGLITPPYAGLFKGRKVGQILDIADRVLGGQLPQSLGLPNCDALVQILQAVNGNYEFIDMDHFTDRGFLTPNRTFGQPDPPHDPHVP